MSVLLIIVGLALLGTAAYVWITSYKQNPHDIQGKVQDVIQDKYSDKMNRWAARKEAKAATARADTAAAVNIEATNVADMYNRQTVAEENKKRFESTPERLRREAEATEAAHDVFLETKATELLSQQVQQQMLVVANNLGVPYTVFEAMMQKQKLDELELQKLAAEKRIVLEAGFLYQLRGFHQLFMLRNRMDEFD